MRVGSGLGLVLAVGLVLVSAGFLSCSDHLGPIDCPCEGVTCSGHGYCVLQEEETVCVCKVGFHAEELECVADPDPCEGIDCSGRGSCLVTGGQPGCECHPGYAGDDCQDCGADYQQQGETCISDTLAHHDGDLSNLNYDLLSPWVRFSSEKSELAIRFQAPASPTWLRTARLWTNNGTDADIPFEIQIYTGSTPSLGLDSFYPTAAQGSGWLEVDLEDAEVVEGSVWIVIRWDPPPLTLENGSNSFYLCLDRTDFDPGDDNYRVYMGTGEWVTTEALGWPTQDLFVDLDVVY